MNAVAMWLIGATVLFLATLIADAILARRRPLAMSALWNAVLVAALAIGPAVWLLPRWELRVLPAEEPAPVVTDASTPIHIDRAGRLAAGPPSPAPRTVQLPSRNYGPAPPPEAFAQVTPPSRPALLPAWSLGVVAIAAVLHVSGLTLLLLRLLANLIAVRRLRHEAQAVDSGTWLARFERWRRTIAPWRAVTLLKSDAVSVPIVLGSRRPAVVIPVGLAEETDASLIDAVLVHELAHVERADCGWQLVERLVQAFYWFHPLIWLASRRIAAVRERACDDFAIHILADRDSYARTLLEMAARLTRQQQAARRQRLGLAMAVVRTSKLEHRLAAIETAEGSPRHRWRRAPRLALTAAVIVAMLLGVSMRLVAARQQAQPAADDWKPTEAEPSESAKSTAAGKDTTAATAKSDETITDFVRDAFPQQQKDLVKKFHGLLAANQVNEAVKLFAPALQEQLPAADLNELIAAFKSEFSPLESRLVLSSKRAGTQELLDVQSSWGRHRLSTAFHFNAANQIDGLWFSLDPRYKQFAPELTHITLKGKTYDLTADELVLGAELVQLAKANKSLTVRFVDANGNAAEARHTMFYRGLGPDEAAHPDEWHDSTTGKIWRIIRGESRVDGRAERLAPGTYRAVNSSFGGFGYQLSDPIVIEDDQQNVAIDVPIRPTGNLTVKAVDATTGEPLPGCSVTLVADDPKLPSYSISGNYEEGMATIKGLAPGQHRLTVNLGAKRLGELDYEQSEQLVNIIAGENAPITVRLQGKQITPADNVRRWPYFVSGRVTDGAGLPIEGAEISALIVHGIERERGHVTSDADGRYRLQFGSGLVHAAKMELLATVQITKPGYYDRDALTRKQLILLNQNQLPDNASGGVTYLMPKQTLELDFVLLPGVELSTEFVDFAEKPIADEELSLLAQLTAGPRRASGGKTSPQGELTTESLAPQQAYHWARIGNGVFPARSRPFRFSSPGKYRMRVRSTQAEPTDIARLTIVHVLNEAGKDVTAEVVGDDPLLRDPLPAELQTACQQLVDKLLAANRLWLTPPPEDLRYSFELKFDEIGDNKRMSFELPASKTTNVLARHGVSYASPLMKLGDRENVVYRAMEVTPGKTVLAYTFKKPVRIMVGNGVDDFWRGSIQSYSREGILVIDSARNVPLEVLGDMLVERFDDYRSLGSGQMAPLRISIASSDDWIWRDTKMNFEWEFQVLEPDLWMFHRARNPQAPDGPPIMTLENLQIDGQPARRIDTLDDRRLPPQVR